MEKVARKQEEPIPYSLGFDNERLILPYDCKQGDVLLLEGPPGTFKRTLAVNFLIGGLVQGEDVLLVGLSDRPSFLPGIQNRVSELLCGGVRERLHLNTVCKFIAQSHCEELAQYRDIVLEYRRRKLKRPHGKDYQELVYTTRDRIKKVLQEHPYNELHRDERLSNIRQKIQGRMFRPLEKVQHTTKYSKQCFIYNDIFRFTEIAFKSGYILPEEFIQTMRDILLEAEQQEHPITRIVSSNIGLLGVSYPLLRSSKTAGDLFLTAFVHIIRNYKNISLLMTGATGQYSEADEMISRARALADTVLKCSFCDIFGDRYVVIEGEGLTAGPGVQQTPSGAATAQTQKEYGEYTPGVIVPREHWRVSPSDANAPSPQKVLTFSTFEVDVKRLEGLVGFNTGQLHRPGIIFYTFEEGDIHARYNDNIRRLLRYTFGVSGAGIEPLKLLEQAKHELGTLEPKILIPEGDTTVTVEPFSSYDSEALHSSLDEFGGQPLDKTISYTVDEFYLNEEPGLSLTDRRDKARDAFINLGRYPTDKGDLIRPFKHFQDSDTNYIWPYYSNVLLLVYRFADDTGKVILNKKGIGQWPISPWKSWQNVRDFATQLVAKLKNSGSGSAQDYCEFEYYHCVSETLSCLLLDALVSGSRPTSASEHQDIRWTSLLGAEQLTDEQIKELRALQDLLVASEKARNHTRKSVEPRTLRDENPYIKVNASVYLCWYSQLRELLELHPTLADKIRVAALPGGGFRGDWYIGVSRGSVSNELGKQLVHMLCSKREQYKRFALGVGLPTLQSFTEPENNYFAWPYGENVPVKLLYDIHSRPQTNTRRAIPDYNNFRSTLTTICQQLIRPDYDKLKETRGLLEDKVKMNVGRLFRQIAMLSDKYGPNHIAKGR